MLRDQLSRLHAVEDVSLVYGQPQETADGSTVITVARTSALLRSARPVGVFVVHNGSVTWAPAVDETRIALMAELIGLLAAVIATLAVLRRPPWPDLSRDGLAAMRRR
ncbi:hypothetical protein OG874_07075 [Nocardia sp. NBC_00565]|uniref:hypothetical protein n=1 Tax=Nocardia sp. NBC_00565 TaxID=2975993 RepID=UPI002E812B4C|nr:hypothetical protein [Nocardia sp. NBC_00565]WUC04912.1 hypothetical protein OG874_07075 [Nocardia sp. NBC_00565]